MPVIKMPVIKMPANKLPLKSEDKKSVDSQNEMVERQVSEMPSLLKISLVLALAISLTSTAVYVATFSHGTINGVPYIALAALASLIATVTPIWLERLIINGGTYQLAVIGWRMGTMLMALALASLFPLPARNCILTTLLACYFVTLPLESWLLARRTRR